MSTRPDAPRDDRVLDTRVDSPGREGLTGTASSNAYEAVRERDEMTLAPDGRPDADQPAWRRDFPIDWPRDQYVARRDFSKFLVLTSLAFVVGQAWIGVLNAARRRRGAPPIQEVALLADLPVGKARTFDYPSPGRTCVLVRLDEATLLAYEQSCTHLSCAVIPRVERREFHCPCHEGRFDMESGRPIAGPPRRPLTRVVLEVRGDRVYAVGIERRTV